MRSSFACQGYAAGATKGKGKRADGGKGKEKGKGKNTDYWGGKDSLLHGLMRRYLEAL